MKRLITVFASILAVLLAVGCATVKAPVREAGREYTLTVLHTNDHHGTVLAKDGAAGLAERMTFVRQVRADNQNVLLLDAGDINTGSALSNMFKGQP